MLISGHKGSPQLPIRGTIAFIFMIFTQWFMWSPPTFSAMYRCEDQSGTLVLTDNPAQLNRCSRLESLTPPPQNLQKTIVAPKEIPIPPSPQLPKDSSSFSNTPVGQQTQQDSRPNENIIIPLQKIGGSFVVQATLNKERTAQLIVDTGATMTVLSTDVALDLGILGTTNNELLTVHTAGGSIQVNKNFLTTLAVGNAQAQNVAVAIHDLPDITEPIEGLLGMSFLKHFLITLDAEGSKLTLRPKPHS